MASLPANSSNERTQLLPGSESRRRATLEATLSQITARMIHDVKRVAFTSYTSILLVFVPLGIIAGACRWNYIAVFVLNFLAIFPLSPVIFTASEELSTLLGGTLGGLFSSQWGNFVELIVSIVALKNGEIRIVQSSILGTILFNNLVGFGCSFVAGSVFARTVQVGQDLFLPVASTMMSLMAVASYSLIIPTALYSAYSFPGADSEQFILYLSHAFAMILLVLYIVYNVYVLKTNSHLFIVDYESDEQEDVEEIKPSPWIAPVVLACAISALVACSEYLVDSIDSITSLAISRKFVALFLFPILGGASDLSRAVNHAAKGQMDLAMAITIGSSIQIALLLTPLLVILGWIINQPMSLHFQTPETVTFFLSVLVMMYVVQDGRSNYLKATMLLGLYNMVLVSFVVYPDDQVITPGHS